MENILKSAVLKTLAYSDIFDFPLTREELHLYLEGFALESSNQLTIETLRQLAEVETEKGYLFLEGRGNNVALRQQREEWSRRKYNLACRTERYIKLIPSLKMLAVTGATAAGNAEENSDIDLFIITAPHRLWTTRLAEKVITEILGIRRHPNSPKTNNKLCPNMYLNASQLELPHKDLFTAREIAQMKVILNRDSTYEQFLLANKWVRDFLPNWYCVVTSKFQIPNSKFQTAGKERLEAKNSSRNTTDAQIAISHSPCQELALRRARDYYRSVAGSIANLLESLARSLQLKYMARKRTTEIVTDTLLMFHPDNQRVRILREYRERVRTLSSQSSPTAL
ncbi:nucleotidyltransferase domain-containing protein [Patescibacteria group bacterium]|nr:nucleotidyltransferase domain-containing protein [Patescibacteria group bacterium]